MESPPLKVSPELEDVSGESHKEVNDDGSEMVFAGQHCFADGRWDTGAPFWRSVCSYRKLLLVHCNRCWELSLLRLGLRLLA